MGSQKTNGNLLDVNNIEVVYNDIVQVLRGVSLNVAEGGIVALLGTNGAGKTTTLRAISGLLKPENGFIKDGFIKFEGNDITNVLGTHVVKLGAVMVPEGRRVFKHLTVDENIRVGSITRRDGTQNVRKDQDLMYDHFPRLARVTNRLAGYCSGGEQQMIAIARALMSAPKMLMLDEPTIGFSTEEGESPGFFDVILIIIFQAAFLDVVHPLSMLFLPPVYVAPTGLPTNSSVENALVNLLFAAPTSKL